MIGNEIQNRVILLKTFSMLPLILYSQKYAWLFESKVLMGFSKSSVSREPSCTKRIYIINVKIWVMLSVLQNVYLLSRVLVRKDSNIGVDRICLFDGTLSCAIVFYIFIVGTLIVVSSWFVIVKNVKWRRCHTNYRMAHYTNPLPP